MKKRFVVLHDTCTDEESEKIRAHFGPSLGWWHWLPNVWLVVDLQNRFTALKLRDDLRTLIPERHVMVLEFSDTGDTWAGFGPSSPERNMFDWMRTNWEKK